VAQSVAEAREVARYIGLLRPWVNIVMNCGGDVESTVRALARAVVAYLVEHPSTTVTEVYLLAYTDAELATCRKVFAENGRLSELTHTG
jgi:hypothetical protein